MFGGQRSARHVQNRGHQVDPVDEVLFVEAIGLHVSGPSHDPRRPNALQVAVLLGNGSWAPVVAHEHHDGIVRAARGVQSREQRADRVVAALAGVVVVGQFLPDFGGVGQIAGDLDFLGLVEP